jgi:ATP/maltotriose-dependent transcriptional regulator MalT
MVGRTEEMRFITDTILRSDRSGLLVAGQAGVGKTRLIEEVLRLTPDRYVERVAASESLRPLPFGALAQLLPANLQEIDQVDLLSLVGKELQRRAESRPIVLAVDDVHLLDGFSAGFIDFVVARGLATVLLTLRSGSSTPDALGRLVASDGLPRLELQALSRAEFAEMVERALDGLVESDSMERIWEATRGNVLFARELIADGLEAGELVRVQGVWQWAGGVGKAARLQQAIAGRLLGLTEIARRFLELLSIGEPLPLRVAEQVVTPDTLVDLERRGLVAVQDGDAPRLRFSHPLFGEVLRAEMPALRERQLSRQLAEILRTEGSGTPADLLKLAILWRDSGEVVDPAVLAQASHVANQLSDHPLAEALAKESLVQETTFEAQLELGWSLLRQRRFDEAADLLVALVTHEPNDEARERLADGLSLALGHGLGRVDEALAIMAELEHATSGQAARRLIQGYRANLHAFVCEYSQAIELGMQAMDGDVDDRVFVRSLTSVASSLVMVGETDKALSLTETGLACALRVRDELPRAPAWAVSSRCTALTFAGRVAEALELLDFALSIAGHPPDQRAMSSGYRARFLLFQGRAGGAVRTLREAALGLRAEPDYGSWCLALLAEAEALLGNTAAAEEARRGSWALHVNDQLSLVVDKRRALAWVDAQSGHLTEAIRQLWAAADTAAERGQRCFEMVILDDLLRLGEEGAAIRAASVASCIEGAYGEAVGLHAKSVSTRSGLDFERAALLYAEMQFSLIASELWTKASAAYQREGLRARSTKAAKRAHELASLCEGAKVRLMSLPEQVEPLSRRQREVAIQASRGASNAEIAESLSVSVRTVESHLYATFTKLGITSREELAVALAGREE